MQRIIISPLLICVILVLHMLSPAYGQMTSHKYVVENSVFSSGGGAMASDNYIIDATLGQASPIVDSVSGMVSDQYIVAMVSEQYVLTSGFWQVNGDNDNGPTSTTTTTTTTVLTTTTTVIVGQINVDFAAIPRKGFAPLEVSFSNLSTPETYRGFEWNFGDGDNSTEENPKHIYSMSGQYGVKFTVFDANGIPHEKSQQKYLLVLPPLTCIITDILGDSPKINSLRKTRDMLLDNYQGLLLLACYYGNLEELHHIFIARQKLRSRLEALIYENIDLCDTINSGGATIILESRVAELIDFINDLRSEASPALQAEIDIILLGIENGSLLHGLNITIVR